jgi:putative alpha-1,2-mannosidase
MSAWYVFSALGFYPVNPVSEEYVIGSPLFDRVSLSLPGNKTFTLVALNNSPANKYVQSARLNGKRYDKSYITHADIEAGGVLELTMGDKPGKTWGTSAADVPASMSAPAAN